MDGSLHHVAACAARITANSFEIHVLRCGPVAQERIPGDRQDVATMRFHGVDHIADVAIQNPRELLEAR